jgi:hypothetical protein
VYVLRQNCRAAGWRWDSSLNVEGIAPGINMRRLVEKCSPQTTELSVKHSTSVEKQNEMGVLLKKNHRDYTTSMID